jgi:hypothetical protein
MDAILLLVVLIIYIVIASYATRAAMRIVVARGGTQKAKKWMAGLVIAVFVLIPTADHYAGKLYLYYVCAKEGGVKIHRVVEGIEGFQDKHTGADGWFKYGYRFMEGTKPTGKPVRYTLDTTGRIQEETVFSPMAKYVLDHNRSRLFYNITRDESVIEEIKTNEKLAVDTSFYFDGGWFARIYCSGYGGCGTSCGKHVSITKFVTQTLKPVQPMSNGQ